MNPFDIISSACNIGMLVFTIIAVVASVRGVNNKVEVTLRRELAEDNNTSKIKTELKGYITRQVNSKLKEKSENDDSSNRLDRIEDTINQLPMAQELIDMIKDYKKVFDSSVKEAQQAGIDAQQAQSNAQQAENNASATVALILSKLSEYTSTVNREVVIATLRELVIGIQNVIEAERLAEESHQLVGIETIPRKIDTSIHTKEGEENTTNE